MAATAEPVRTYAVLLVEDDRNARELAYLLFERHTDFAIVGEVASADECLDFLADRPVDVVILDHQLEGTRTGAEVASLVKATAPGTRVVLFSGYLQADPGDAAVDGFVHKLQGELLVPTVRSVLGLTD